jgi:hypothetical protein
MVSRETAMSGYVDALERHLAFIQEARTPNWVENGQDYLRRVMGDAMPKTGMLDPSPLLQTMAISIEHADTYWISTPLSELLSIAAASLGEWTCDYGDLPSPAGFCWLEKPLKSTVTGVDIWGLYWAEGIWHETPGRPGYRIREAKLGVDVYENELEPMIWAMTIWGNPSEQLWMSGMPMHQGLVYDEPEASYHQALFRLIAQGVLASSAERPDRAARRRAAQWRPEPVVKVVQLRRLIHPSPTAAAGQDVEWSCQWLVGQHWHRYHTKNGIEKRWLMPYVKGPEDKPLKMPRARVFAVVR